MEKIRIDKEKFDAINDELNENANVQAIEDTQATVGTQVNATNDGTVGEPIQTDSEALLVKEKNTAYLRPISVLDHELRVLERKVQKNGEKIDELVRRRTQVTERDVGEIQGEMAGAEREEVMMEIEDVKIEEDEEAEMEQEEEVRTEGEKTGVESQGAREWLIWTLADSHSVIDT